MLDTVRVTLTRLLRKLAAAETVGEIRLIHDQAETLVTQAAAAADLPMLERAAGIAYDCEHKLGKLAGADDDLGPNAERCRRRGFLSPDDAARDRQRIVAARKRRVTVRGGVPSEQALMVLVPPSTDGAASFYRGRDGIMTRYLVGVNKQAVAAGADESKRAMIAARLAAEAIRQHEGDLRHLVEADVRALLQG